MKNSIRLLVCLFILSSFAFSQHSNTINITWVASGDPPLIFLIQRASVSGGPYTTICGGTGQPICPTGAVTASYIDSTVKAGDIWYYVVLASNFNVATGLGGVGPISNELKRQTPFLPPTTAPVLSGTSQ